jgi:hypothetical protein
LLAIIGLACAPASVGALTLTEAPGSPYQTTDQHFVPGSNAPLGGAVSGDFNGDGISDLAVVDATGVPAFRSGESVTVLLGSRDGGMTIAPSSPIELYSGGIYDSKGPIATGDFTNNGDLDLAVFDNIHDTISILLGDGEGNFHLSGTPMSFSGFEPGSIVVGDFTGDGDEDLAFAAGGRVNVLLGNGKGGFTPAPGSPFAVAGEALSVAAGGFTADGLSDLAVTTDSNEVAIYLATGDGSFVEAPGSPLPTGDGPGSIVAADLNGDGRLDLSIANALSDNVTVLLGNGAGGFSPAEGSPVAVPAGSGESVSDVGGLPDSIAAGDFNGDGKPDLAVANFNGGSANIAILEGDGRGGFTNAAGSPFPANGNPGPLALGDFNGDGHLDAAVVNPFEGFVTVLLNTASEAAEGSPAVGGSVDDGPMANTVSSGAAKPTRSQILALIVRQLAPSGGTARLGSFAIDAGLVLRMQALEAGTEAIDWYTSVGGPRGRHAHSGMTLIASGRATFSGAATKTVTLRLTGAGRSLWKRVKQLKLTARGIFTPSGAGEPITAVRTFVLRK